MTYPVSLLSDISTNTLIEQYIHLKNEIIQNGSKINYEYDLLLSNYIKQELIKRGIEYELTTRNGNTRIS